MGPDRQPRNNSAERRNKIEQALQLVPLSNGDIWAALAIKMFEGGRPLIQERFNQIVDHLKQTQSQDNQAVSELVTDAGVADLRRDRFLSKVSFNYDYQLGGEERLEEALKALARGEIHVVESDAPTFRTLAGWIEHDFYEAGVKTRSYIEKTTGKDVTIYLPNGSPKERGIPVGFVTGAVAAGVTRLTTGDNVLSLYAFLGVGSAIGVLNSTGSGWPAFGAWDTNQHLQAHYERNVLPHLSKEELIKAGYGYPKIKGAKSYPQVATATPIKA
jgi:hypothetical protein